MNELPAAAPRPVAPAQAGPPVVGLGASAGGLEPLTQFLARVPPASGLAYVVVQHLDPTHKALLAQLLQRVTAMPVQEVREPTPVQADQVYVIPPAAEISLRAGVLYLAKPSQPHGRRLPIDVMFSSLARELGERAVGVVLSGMGSDGSAGLQAIKARGGLTLAQQPASAQFDAMPRSAMAAGCVDICDLPSELPARILAVLGQPPPAAGGQAGGDAGALDLILALLQAHTRRDLGLYKPNTMLRRVTRRVAVHGLDSMAAYAELLRANPQELDLLFKEILIGVTAFFRDPEVWQDMANKVLPALMAQRAGEDGPMRAWVPGCSTGEEAYSLAMVFAEIQDTLPPAQRRGLQIFATDLNADAITKARRGRFGAPLAQALAPGRLARFFTERPDGWEIDKRIRDMVLFAEHDLIMDPPFRRLDILSCRNVMIYFGAALQRRLVPLFHYSLRPGGALLLGSSETIGRAQSLFVPLHPKSRIYWRRDNGAGVDTVVFPTGRRPAAPGSPTPTVKESALPHPSPPPANLSSLTEQVLLQSHAPPAVLVNEAGDIVYVSGRTGRYLEPAAGKANWNIHVMARPAMRTQLAVALRKALLERSTVELRALRLDDTTSAAVDVTVQGLAEPRPLQGMALIVFRELPARPRGRGRQAGAEGALQSGLAEELRHAHEEIQALRQEMRASQEELQAANEELQSTNEELQSANEELTTSKEEAQSMNEELQTVNGELQSKLDDLALAQSDMQNLLNSTDIATLFLDEQFNVRRYTEQIARVIHLRESDIGRPLSELASALIYPALHADVQETLRTLAISEKQIATTDGQWFSVRIMPYRTLANVIQGVVITFVDITAAKELEARLREA